MKGIVGQHNTGDGFELEKSGSLYLPCISLGDA